MEKYDETKTQIMNMIDENSRALVGHILKRVEILKDQKVLTPELYKSLTKEHIYESARVLKDKLSLYLTVPSVRFLKNNGKEE